MSKHWQYFKYVLIHKWYVFVWCCHYRIPLAGIVHDWSKFRLSEWGPYADFFYGGPWPEHHYGDWRYLLGDKFTQAWAQRRFDVAWNHHQKRNPHHYQYWILHEDSGAVACLPMPDRYRREMLADWRGAGMAINGKDDTRNWYLKNRTNMLMHPDTRHWVEWELDLLADIDGETVSLADLESSHD